MMSNGVATLENGGSLGSVVTEEFPIPENMVGVVIGRGGEQITRLQAETGVKIQMQPEVPGRNERTVSLTGVQHSIAHAKKLIMDIIQQRNQQQQMNNTMGGGGGGGVPPSGVPASGQQGNIEMVIPATKVGLVIGKGGETIKQLQERFDVKMMVVQESPAQEGDKPLRITGDANRCEAARQAVMDIINEQQGGGGMGMGGLSGMGQLNMGGPPNRSLYFGGSYTGSGTEIRDGQRAGGPFGGPRGPAPWHSGPAGPWGDTGPGPEIYFPVPSSKCGLVIGKGGETIKQINAQSGAHCELDRRPPPNPNEKVFIIRGNPQQIDHAKSLICDKIGLPVSLGPDADMWPPGPWPPGQSHSPHAPPPPSAGPGMGQMAPYQMAQAGMGPPHQGFAAPGAAPGWGNPYNPGSWQPTDPGPAQAPQQPSASGQPDYSSQWVDYYRSMGMHDQANMIEQQAKARAAASAAAVGHSPAAVAPQAAPQQVAGSGAPGGEEPKQDYSKQWVEYYRAQGMVKEAEAIEAQVKARQAAAAGGGGAPAQAYQQAGNQPAYGSSYNATQAYGGGQPYPGY